MAPPETPRPDTPAADAPRPVAALLLAAGGGRRLGGRPKALLPHRGRPLVEHAVRVLREGGCAPAVHVVLGAAADHVRDEADLTGCVLLDNPDWQQGMGGSLHLGLTSLSDADTAAAPSPAPPPALEPVPPSAAPAAATFRSAAAPSAVLVFLVDQPGITPAAVARLLHTVGHSPDVLAAASYGGRRGHPVLLGADHWPGVLREASGDRGARVYLQAHAGELALVECGDVADAADIDTPEDLRLLSP
ncbi:nucleotidyltransferase family protein [Streptomyces sp. Z26]|uniref:nucleotidyltransferase family protein n=1 Tax=Streptomyces TaxID=1883 RepID=UPI000EF16A18|nr:nucleotidyltransferase family protein [Streptomyces sp. Z26]RLL69499.1 nucleotidyltransferase family protein [Streptomyces sp. Z26]